MMSAFVIIPALLVLMLLVLAKRISDQLLHGQRHAVSRTPEDYGLAYEDVTFPGKDGLHLKGWWLPASPECAHSQGGPAPAVILLHPMFGNRQGVSAQDWPWPYRREGSLDLLKVAGRFHAAGHALLLFDFRGHGESQPGICAGGYNEDQDVVGAVDYVFRRMAAEAPGQTAQVGVIGFGLGASAAISAVGREKGDSRTIRVFSADNEGATGLIEFRPANIKRLCYIVAVEPVALRTFLCSSVRLAAPPLGWLLVPMVDRLCRWRGGYPLDGTLLIRFARHVHTPILYVGAQRKSQPGDRELQKLYEATPGPRQVWWIEEGLEPVAVYEHVGNHLDRALAFAEQQLTAGA